MAGRPRLPERNQGPHRHHPPGAREYDPLLGRFISPDPLLLEDDTRQHNAYQYGNNNPLAFADPTGKAFEECFSGQYKCTYGPGRSLDKVEYGKNYEKVTKSLGGTLAPRYVRHRSTMQISCSKDPGCITWDGTHTTRRALAESRELAAQERRDAQADRNIFERFVSNVKMHFRRCNGVLPKWLLWLG